MEILNIRLLADHYAREIGATVYVPDFFGGEVLNFDLVAAEKFHELGLEAFMQRNGREKREPEIFECARALKRELGFAKVGAVGYCYGGWASFRLGGEGAYAGGGRAVGGLYFCWASVASYRGDVDEVDVPVQILAPEVDLAFPVELKKYTFETLLGLNVAFDYQHFPGVGHSCLVRGDVGKDGERAAMERGKDAVVAWFGRWLRDDCA
ncbi:Alpha/Beta hydrolase protein [Penicillium verhagenii]|nr:Alpha/Beta hydrolase protein [Penicillium verhagenii]